MTLALEHSPSFEHGATMLKAGCAQGLLSEIPELETLSSISSSSTSSSTSSAIGSPALANFQLLHKIVPRIKSNLTRTTSLDSRTSSVSTPPSRFAHSSLFCVSTQVRPSFHGISSLSMLTTEDKEQFNREKIARGKNRKLLRTSVSFSNLHGILEVEYSFFRTKPLMTVKRALLKQGMLIKDNGKYLAPRQFFLFTDIIVYGMPVSDGRKLAEGKRLDKQIIVTLANLKVEPIFQDPLSLWFTTGKDTFRVILLTPKDCQEWYHCIMAAIHVHQHQQQKEAKATSKRHSSQNNTKFEMLFLRNWNIQESPMYETFKSWTSLNRKKSNSSLTSESSGISEESINVLWIPDNDATQCMVCNQTKFTILTRKHHCRLCGLVICYKCSKDRFWNKKRMIRVCKICFDQNSYFESKSTSTSNSDSIITSSFSPPPPLVGPIPFTKKCRRRNSYQGSRCGDTTNNISGNIPDASVKMQMSCSEASHLKYSHSNKGVPS